MGHKKSDMTEQLSTTAAIVMLNNLPWKQIKIILSFLRLHPSIAFQTLLPVLCICESASFLL